MDVSALLAQYLSVKSQIGYYQLEETKWANLHENMAAKLSKQTSAEGKWESSSDAAEEACFDDDKSLKIQNNEVKSKSQTISSQKAQKYAISYANWKVPQYDPEKLEEYAALDIEYDMMQSTYDTLLEELNAQAESLKSQLGNATKDTGMLDA